MADKIDTLPPAPGAEDADYIGADRSLLIVDDDGPFLRRLARAMETRGFDVEMAESVAEGIAKAKGTPPKYAVVDLRLSDARVSLIVEGVDPAIRMGQLEDSDLVARRIGQVAMRLVAAPAYLAAQGEPAAPADLARHRAILTRRDLDHWQSAGAKFRPLWCLARGA